MAIIIKKALPDRYLITGYNDAASIAHFIKYGIYRDEVFLVYTPT